MKKDRLLDRSYKERMGKITMDEYVEVIETRRKRVQNFFDFLPATLKTPENLQYKGLDRKIVAQLKVIESLDAEWVYNLKDKDVLFQELEEKKAYFWSCTKEMGRFLHTLILALKPRCVLELGTSVGYSALWMADACAKVDGKIITIEYLDEKVKLAREFFEKAQVNKLVELIQGDIRKILEDWEVNKAKPNFVFMDANAEWQRFYLTLLGKLLPVGSLIVTDNVYDTYDIREEFLIEAYRSKLFISLFIQLDTHGTLVSVKI